MVTEEDVRVLINQNSEIWNFSDRDIFFIKNSSTHVLITYHSIYGPKRACIPIKNFKDIIRDRKIKEVLNGN
jgi:hypothetical protein